jgi:hypothetical protein
MSHNIRKKRSADGDKMNTEKENQDISDAIFLIFAKYGENIRTNQDNNSFLEDRKTKGKDCFNQWFKFQDQEVFAKTLLFSGQRLRQGNCTTCAITVPSARSISTNGAVHEVYLNRASANQTTIVHELLHFFTDKKFDQTVNATVNEAVTEYFTRKVLGQDLGDRVKKSGFDIAGRTGRYDQEHIAIMGFRQRAENEQISEPNYFKRGYFEGDVECCQKIAFAAFGSKILTT